MIAVVTSIGEPTTELCTWSLTRQGFEVIVIDDQLPLAYKLQAIYSLMDSDFLRVDADVIVSRGIMKTIDNPPYNDSTWWVQFRTFDMYMQQITNGGIQYIRKEAIPAMRANIGNFLHDDRPETRMWNLEEFHKPRRCFTYPNRIAGIHGFGQKDIERVQEVKYGRKNVEVFDFELAERMQEFYK